jgi:hypothetical protein
MAEQKLSALVLVSIWLWAYMGGNKGDKHGYQIRRR